MALTAALAALATADGASAGSLQLNASGNLVYSHSPLFESFQAHDVVVVPEPGGYRISDAGTDIAICPPQDPSDPNPPCRPPPCDYDGSFREVVCVGPLPGLWVFLGESNDRLENRTALSTFACGGAGSDVLIGGSGNDIVGGGAGRDDVHGGAGNDSIAVDIAKAVSPAPRSCDPGPNAARFELLDGGRGRDIIDGGPGDDTIAGGDDDDILRGFGGDDRIDGGAGRDDLVGLEGNDKLLGNADGDFLFGGAGADDLQGGPGGDDLGRTLVFDADGVGIGTATATSVEDGDDRLDGGDGRDVMTAGPGTSRYDTADSLALLLQGIVDRRLLSPALNGADRYIGGADEDLVTYVNRDVPVQITLDGLANDGSAGEGDLVDADVDRVWGGSRADVLVAAPGGSLLFGDLGPDRIVGGPGRDLLSGGPDDSADAISGAGGDDEIAGNAGNDDLDGGTGRDIVFAGSGDDTAAGGKGDDRIEGAAGSDRLDGGPGVDCLHGFRLPESEPACATGQDQPPPAGADGGDELIGGAGRDLLFGGDGADVADYSASRRRVVVALPGARRTTATPGDRLAADVEGARGGRGPDVLIGNAADNMLDGGPGDDHVDGADGVDRLRGGSGQDMVVARDREPDAVRCGTKSDFALIDAADELVAALSDVCEWVDGAGSSFGPVLGPRRGCVLAIRPPGVMRWFPLRLHASLPARTAVDASTCPARLGGALVRGGAFVLQPAGRRLVLRLHGGRACRGSAARSRRLEVRRAPGWLAVRGRELTATGPGASWTTIDGCRGTRVKVRSGRVRATP